MFVLPNIGKIYHILAMDKDTQFVGQSLAFLDTVELAGRAAELNRPALVVGERGTGKELIAERIHRLSYRWSGPLIVMYCAALPDTLIETALFGHEAGRSEEHTSELQSLMRNSYAVFRLN